jgi:radical SAM protein with 4Fe4S-binding SPASM domain
MTATPMPAPDPVRTFSLGLGLTNECNLACSFCYRDPDRVDRLGPTQVRAVLDRLPVRSVNLGTGENGMHPQFPALLDLLRAEPIKLTITSNGHSIAMIDDAAVQAFADIEFSIDYLTKAEQDAQRGDGNWDLVMEQASRCRRLGVGVTFIAVMMRTNFDRLHEIAAIAKAFDAPLRINVYQAVRTDAFALTYEEYWSGFERLLAETDVIAIGEPLVRAMAGMPARKGGCGVGTVRVTPRATVQPCVYWGAGQSLDTLLEAGAGILDTAPFVAARSLPEPCRGCIHEASCHGGCAGRRRLLDRLDEVDPYCPIVRGEDRPLAVTMAATRDLPKLESACTTIVQARG